MHPVMFRVGPMTVYYYGVIVAIAFSLGTYLIVRTASAMGLEKNKMTDLMLVILVSGIVGARALHVVLNLGYYSRHILEIIMFTKGGLAFQGGLLTSVAAAVFFMKKHKMPVYKVGDIMAPFIALGHSIGRLGCFMNGCCYGKEIKIYEGLFFVFPVQLLSSFLLIVIYLVLRFMLDKGILRNNLFFFYVALYSFYRFFIEFLRGDSKDVFLFMDTPQLFSVLFFMAASIMLLRRTLFCRNMNL